MADSLLDRIRDVGLSLVLSRGTIIRDIYKEGRAERIIINLIFLLYELLEQIKHYRIVKEVE